MPNVQVLHGAPQMRTFVSFIFIIGEFVDIFITFICYNTALISLRRFPEKKSQHIARFSLKYFVEGNSPSILPLTLI